MNRMKNLPIKLRNRSLKPKMTNTTLRIKDTNFMDHEPINVTMIKHITFMLFLTNICHDVY